jgi:hypothetical protein
MKKLATLLFLLLIGVSFAQTSQDIITQPIDIKYLNSLVLKTCNDRTPNLNVLKQSHPLTFQCAEYQSAYQSKYSVCTHTDTTYFRGYHLKTIVNRMEFFNKSVQVNGSIAEICTFATIDYGETTYGELATHIIDNFFGSNPHRKTIMIDYPYGDFSCTQGVYDGQKGVYVTGFFSR